MHVLQDAQEMGVDERHITLLREFSKGQRNEDVAEIMGISSRTVRNYKRSAIIAIQEAYESVTKV
jgi:DNA-binding CsgD family transcriptional regulator